MLIRLLAYYVTWHLQHKLAPVSFQDDDPAAAGAHCGPARSRPPAELLGLSLGYM
ncbi:MAG: hypothetical protein JO037_11420 [Actinobacteria bacterium]|nr:hypothetical protein [Actinomycetota bacterium]